MGWVSISAVFGHVVVSRPNGGVALDKKELVLLAGAFDPARFPLLWNPWAWLAVLPTLLAVRICVSLV